MMIVIIIIIISFSLQHIYSNTATAIDMSNIRYNSLISAQCKARCLYEYQTRLHQQRSLPTTSNNGKMKRLLVRSKSTKENFFIYN